MTTGFTFLLDGTCDSASFPINRMWLAIQKVNPESLSFNILEPSGDRRSNFLPSAVRPNQMLSKNLTIWLEGNCHLAKRRVQSYLAQAWDNKLRIDSGSFVGNRFYCLKPGLDWTRLFMSLTAGAGTRCMSLLPDSPSLWPKAGRRRTNLWQKKVRD